MRTFCFSPFTSNFFCFFAFAAGFLFSLAFFGTSHYRKSRTVPVSLPRVESGRYNGTDSNIFCIGEDVLYVHVVVFFLVRFIHPLNQDFILSPKHVLRHQTTVARNDFPCSNTVLSTYMFEPRTCTRVCV